MKNQKGFSLIEVMISCGLMTIVALGMAQITANAAKASFTASVNSNIQGLIGQIRNAVNTDSMAVCGQDVSGEIQIVNPLNTSQVIAKSGMQFDNKTWSINSVVLANQSNSNGKLKGTVTVILSKNNKRLNGAPILTKVITDVYCVVNNGHDDNGDNGGHDGNGGEHGDNGHD